MNTFKYQTGKGLIGFIFGLLLATIIIAGVLFYLNKNKTEFKTPVGNLSASKPTEILTPAKTDVTASMPITSEENNQISDIAASALPVSDNIEYTETEHNNQTVTTITPTENTSTSTSSNHQNTPSKPPKVTPEQILNSGSLEKAQQNHGKNTGKVFLQIGSFSSSTEADAQRAKLVMLGIETHIQTAKINGTTKYRIQTNNLDQNQLENIKKILQEHKIANLTRTAS